MSDKLQPVQWEYTVHVVRYRKGETTMDALQNYGKQGWEAWALNVLDYDIEIFFKRSMQVHT